MVSKEKKVKEKKDRQEFFLDQKYKKIKNVGKIISKLLVKNL